MMKYEIINPSDVAYIESDDFKVVCVATAFLGNGLYGLKSIGGEIKMPAIAFDKMWFDKTFHETMDAAFTLMSKTELIEVLKTVHLESEQTSVNDIVGYANYMIERLEDL